MDVRWPLPLQTEIRFPPTVASTQRPNIVGTPKRNHGSDFMDNYFADNSVFQRPDDFTLGNAPRALGSVRSPVVLHHRSVFGETVPDSRGDEL